MVVEDSPTESAIIRRTINAAPDLQVVGEARDGVEGLKKLAELQPDVVCTDYYMPNMNGLEFVAKAMALRPCPILVLSVGVQSYQFDNVFKMLSAGAIDVMPKPASGLGNGQLLEISALHEKIRHLARIGLAHLRSHGSKAGDSTPLFVGARRPGWKPSLFVIGGSTGAPQALEQILALLPAHFPCPIACVQHISQGFIHGMADWLNDHAKLRITVCQDGDLLKPGCLCLSQDNAHMEINAHDQCHTVALSDGEIYPSIDRLFRSAAATHGDQCVGILLSGMGMDGAVGMRAIQYAGGITLAQAPETAVIDSMPRTAIDSGSVQYVLPPEGIAAMMRKLAHNV